MGPLSGTRVTEIAGIGPGPFAAMMLADMGADVIRVDRAAAVRSAGGSGRPPRDAVGRGRRSIGIDLKHPLGADLLLRLAERSDVLIEGFRPGVAERLGIGPDACLARNPRLVYGRMIGWGQAGPLAARAGHDINYIAVSGTLDLLGRAGAPPTPPANLIGDFGGGGMLLAFGVACALIERSASGRGQVIDAAMVDGAALLATFFHTMKLGPRGTNLLDTGAPFYDVYECADGRWVSVGALEPQFYAELRRVMGLTGEHWDRQMDASGWPAMRKDLAEAFASRPRDEWCAAFEGADACFAPVLSLAEAPDFPHNQARATFTAANGAVQPSPAPRFSRTPAELGRAPVWPGADTASVLAEMGLSEQDQARLREESVVR